MDVDVLHNEGEGNQGEIIVNRIENCQNFVLGITNEAAMQLTKAGIVVYNEKTGNIWHERYLGDKNVNTGRLVNLL